MLSRAMALSSRSPSFGVMHVLSLKAGSPQTCPRSLSLTPLGWLRDVTDQTAVEKPCRGLYCRGPLSLRGKPWLQTDNKHNLFGFNTVTKGGSARGF